MNTDEFKVLKKVHETAKKGDFAEPLLSGKALVFDSMLTITVGDVTIAQKMNYEDKTFSFIIQTKFGKTLDDFMIERQRPFSIKTVV